MNPVFIFLVILGSVLLWFLLSFTFFPLGNLFSNIWKDTIDRMNKEDINDEKETEK